MNSCPIELQGKGLDSRPREELIEIARKGGQSKSIKKSDGQKMRWIKEHIRKGELKDLDSKWLLERLESREAMALDILSEFDKLKHNKQYNNLTFDEYLQYLKTYTFLLKSIHGNKIQIETENTTPTTININMSMKSYPELTPINNSTLNNPPLDFDKE